jgi:hypothetical protein
MTFISSKNDRTKLELKMSMTSAAERMTNKILVLYCYFEKNINYINNLKLFLKLGLYDECDYLFIINGKISIEIPEKNNIKVLYRKNEDYDFGAYNDALETININKYYYYFFINTSVRGPFIPSYVKIKWYEPFINLLIDDIKLVGTSINILDKDTNESNAFYNKTNFVKPYTHVQTQMFAMTRECLEFLMFSKLFSNNDYNNWSEFIAMKEILMSQLVLKNNWNISCIIPEYQNIDYRLLNNDLNFSSNHGDPNFTNATFGRTVHPYESIFIKINRDLCVNEINSISNFLLKK